MFGEVYGSPKTTLVEVPGWPALLSRGQATLAFSLLDNGPLSCLLRKPSGIIPLPPQFSFLPTPTLCQEVTLPFWSPWDSQKGTRQRKGSSENSGTSSGDMKAEVGQVCGLRQSGQASRKGAPQGGIWGTLGGSARPSHMPICGAGRPEDPRYISKS
jgi:hypothetical protein